MGNPYPGEDGAASRRGGNAWDEAEGFDQARLSESVQVGQLEHGDPGSIDAFPIEGGRS